MKENPKNKQTIYFTHGILYLRCYVVWTGNTCFLIPFSFSGLSFRNWINHCRGGNHGYDNIYKSMEVTFYDDNWYDFMVCLVDIIDQILHSDCNVIETHVFEDDRYQILVKMLKDLIILS